MHFLNISNIKIDILREFFLYPLANKVKHVHTYVSIIK